MYCRLNNTVHYSVTVTCITSIISCTYTSTCSFEGDPNFIWSSQVYVVLPRVLHALVQDQTASCGNNNFNSKIRDAAQQMESRAITALLQLMCIVLGLCLEISLKLLAMWNRMSGLGSLTSSFMHIHYAHSLCNDCKLVCWAFSVCFYYSQPRCIAFYQNTHWYVSAGVHITTWQWPISRCNEKRWHLNSETS